MNKITLILLLFTGVAMADTSSLNLSLPSTPGSYGQDSIKAGDLDCKNAIGGSTSLEFGVTGIISDPMDNLYGSSTKNVGVFAKIVIPLDGPKERINCNSLYELELRKKRLEVLKLQEELEALKRMNTNNNFEN